jgi:hypothetical protein
VLAGAPFRTSGTGAAYVFTRSATGAWTQKARLTATGGLASDNFGNAVALTGATALIGASGTSNSTGAAYVFARSAAGAWSQQAELTAVGGVAGDNLGWSVAIAGSTAVVGAVFGNSHTGAAYVFVRSGAAWSQQARLTAAGGASGSEFGFSVAISGSTVLVGAIDAGSGRGAGYLFTRSGTAWSQQARLTAADAPAGAQFGFSVAISGSTAVLGAPARSASTGAAYVLGNL